MDFLVEHAEAFQEAVFFSAATLLNLEVDLLFFDTTSTYFEVEEDEAEAGLRRFGHSKDHRPDLPQVVIGLAVTRDGITVRCWVLPGNTADAALVEMVQQDLAGWKLCRVIWVTDRGMAGEAQRRALQRGCWCAWRAGNGRDMAPDPGGAGGDRTRRSSRNRRGPPSEEDAQRRPTQAHAAT